MRKSWEVHNHECPDSIFSEISSATGVDESVEGVVNFYTHEIPEYSFFNLHRNAEEVVRATTMAVPLPISVDNQIYHNDGICFIQPSPRAATAAEKQIPISGAYQDAVVNSTRASLHDYAPR